MPPRIQAAHRVLLSVSSALNDDLWICAGYGQFSNYLFG